MVEQEAALSYSSDVKNELARLEGQKPCCEKAELLGVLRMSGALVLRGKNIGIHFSTENAALARRVLQVLKSNYQVRTEVVITRSRRLKKNNRYQVEVLPDSRVADALRELQILPSEEDVKRSNLLGKVCCRKAFLRGVFMAGGSVSRPSGDYHMEIVTETEELARLVLKVMHG
ncbi:MAG: DNA-binding protein WhiA, partial [Acidaminococcaceae bacterium]|nr:DNA-binding protein WhiA [Acidaminococcaceae bacterium]